MAETSQSRAAGSERLMMIAWMLIVLAVLGAGAYYVGWRLIVPFHLRTAGKIAAWSALALVIILPFVSMMVMRRGGAWTIPLAWVAYISLGFLSLVVTLLVARDLFLLG